MDAAAAAIAVAAVVAVDAERDGGQSIAGRQAWFRLDGGALVTWAGGEANASSPDAAQRWSATVLPFALLWLLTVSTTATAGGQLWIWFDVDGTPNISDRHDDPRAVPYRIGTFEEIALRQQNTPHLGLGSQQQHSSAPTVPPGIYALVCEMAARHKVPQSLLLAVVGVESGFRSGLTSRAGAQGLMQLMPATAEDLEVDATVPRENVDGGARYLAWLLKYFGDERLALAGYNAGPGRVKRAGNQIPDIKETRAYVDNVTALRDAFAAAGM